MNKEDSDYADSLAVDVIKRLTELQSHKKMPNSIVARKMGLTRKHVEEIVQVRSTIQELARIFYVLGYRLQIHTEEMTTGEKEQICPRPKK